MLSATRETFTLTATRCRLSFPAESLPRAVHAIADRHNFFPDLDQRGVDFLS
jgi:hypothetical protein